ncbi:MULTISPECIES: hypothetical protein [unclassified Microcoleus]|nr:MULTISPECIES: hypothetical protein [unclassified Microcoleus]
MIITSVDRSFLLKRSHSVQRSQCLVFGVKGDRNSYNITLFGIML